MDWIDPRYTVATESTTTPGRKGRKRAVRYAAEAYALGHNEALSSPLAGIYERAKAEGDRSMVAEVERRLPREGVAQLTTMLS